MTTRKLTIEYDNLSNTECGWLAITAAEGGINYWAEAEEYDWTRWQDEESGEPLEIPDDFVFYSVRDKESDEDGWHPVTPETFRRGMELLFDKHKQLYVGGYFIHNDRSEWEAADADAADVLVQLGIFGEVVYG